MEYYTKIIKAGNYTREGKTHFVSILKQNWDFYYEEEYDDGEPDLDNDGYAYYVVYGTYNDLLYANRSHTCISEKEAVELAGKTIRDKICWTT